VELRQLQIVRVVAEKGSFTQSRSVAEVVPVSCQPPDPDARRGTRRAAVFSAYGRSIRITAAGATLVALGTRVTADIAAARAQIRETRGSLNGTIRLVGE
jgi:DNA-binding transcriptional LysR family regulator